MARSDEIGYMTEATVRRAVGECWGPTGDMQGMPVIQGCIELGVQRPMFTIMRFLSDDAASGRRHGAALRRCKRYLPLLRKKLTTKLLDVCMLNYLPGAPWSPHEMFKYAMVKYLWRFANYGPDGAEPF